jgi:hypothetical protein
MGYARAPPLQDPGGCGSREAGREGRETRGLGDARGETESRDGRVPSRWSCALAVVVCSHD